MPTLSVFRICEQMAAGGARVGVGVGRGNKARDWPHDSDSLRFEFDSLKNWGGGSAVDRFAWVRLLNTTRGIPRLLSSTRPSLGLGRRRAVVVVFEVKALVHGVVMHDGVISLPDAGGLPGGRVTEQILRSVGCPSLVLPARRHIRGVVTWVSHEVCGWGSIDCGVFPKSAIWEGYLRQSKRGYLGGPGMEGRSRIWRGGGVEVRSAYAK
eukprot:760765-Hanusia_phi.AAC.2